MTIRTSPNAPATSTYILKTADATLANAQVLSALSTGLAVVTTTTGVISTVAAPTGTVVGTSDTQTLTNKTIGTTNLISFNSPDSFVINGKITPSVASNNLTIALKGLDGNDPSATNPVYVRIFDTIRTVTSALSVVLNAGTNWCNLGSSELATKEQDLFCFLVYETAASSVRIAISRIPYGNTIGDFNTTSTNEKGIPWSGNSYVSTDPVVNIGRFAATLSAGAGYTWTVPTYTASNLIQRTSFHTRWLTYVPTFTITNPPSATTTTATYRISENSLSAIGRLTGTANASAMGTQPRATVPMNGTTGRANVAVCGGWAWTDDATFAEGSYVGFWFETANTNTVGPFVTATRKPVAVSFSVTYSI